MNSLNRSKNRSQILNLSQNYRLTARSFKSPQPNATLAVTGTGLCVQDAAREWETYTASQELICCYAENAAGLNT